jgi:hypothetical protein
MAAAQEKRPGRNSGPSSLRLRGGLVIHATHTTTGHARSSAIFLRPFGDHGFRGDQKTGDRRCILQGRPNNLGWINWRGGAERGAGLSPSFEPRRRRRRFLFGFIGWWPARPSHGVSFADGGLATTRSAEHRDQVP